MGTKLATCLGIFLAASISTHAVAQNVGDFANMFGTMMRAAIIDHARTEWSKIPPNETSCIEQELEQRGSSINLLVQKGIVPGDPMGVIGKQARGANNQTPPGETQPGGAYRDASEIHLDASQTIARGERDA
jgi:hypothetical protein